jgi:hypothetical protein
VKATLITFPGRLFPLKVEAFTERDGKLVWATTVERPEGFTALEIPPLKEQFGCRVAIRVTYGDGTVENINPAGDREVLGGRVN